MTAQVWRVVDLAGAVREVSVRCVWESPDSPHSRWRIEAPGESADIDCDEDDTPREALCRWTAFRFTEIRGPGELTTAEQLAAVQARADAALIDLEQYQQAHAASQRALARVTEQRDEMRSRLDEIDGMVKLIGSLREGPAR